MSTATRTLKAVFDGDSDKFSQAAKKAERDLERFEKRGKGASKQTRGLGSASAGAAGAMGGLVTKLGPLGLGIGALGAALIAPVAGLMAIGDEAIRLNLSVGKAKTVFGDAFPKMNKWATESANAVGLTRLEALGLGSDLQDFMVPMGMSRDMAADSTLRFMNLAGALSINSQGTLEAADVATVFTSALAGEYDSLQRLGININAARVAQVANNIQKKSSTKLTDDQARMLAILKIAEQDSTDATTLATTAEGKQAPKIKETKAKLREKWEEIQVKLLPVIAKLYQIFEDKVLPILEDFVAWLGSPEGKRAIEGWIDTVGGIVNVVGDVIGVVSTAIGMLSDFNSEANATLSGNRGVGDIVRFGIQAGRRAHGGPVEGGRSYVVGERGPELFTPRSGGQITANDKLSGAGIHIENFNLSAYSDRFSLRQVKDELAFSGGI